MKNDPKQPPTIPIKIVAGKSSEDTIGSPPTVTDPNLRIPVPPAR